MEINHKEMGKDVYTKPHHSPTARNWDVHDNKMCLCLAPGMRIKYQDTDCKFSSLGVCEHEILVWSNRRTEKGIDYSIGSSSCTKVGPSLIHAAECTNVGKYILEFQFACIPDGSCQNFKPDRASHCGKPWKEEFVWQPDWNENKAL